MIYKYHIELQLDHPAIVRFHDSFMEKDVFCIVTEYCEVNLCWLHECTVLLVVTNYRNFNLH